MSTEHAVRRKPDVALELAPWLVVTGALLFVAFYRHQEPPAFNAWAVNAIVSVVALFVAASRAIKSYRRVERMTMTGSLMISSLNIFCVVIPSASLVWRSRQATVERLLGVEIATQSNLEFALNMFSACILAFLFCEMFATSLCERNQASTQPREQTLNQAAAIPLYCIGIATYLYDLSRGIGADFATRGEVEGGGLVSMAHWSLPLAIALAILNRHWEDKRFMALSILGVLLIASSGVRSPLVLIAVAYVPRVIQSLSREKRPTYYWWALFLAASLFVSVGAALNTWRGAIRRGESLTLYEALGNAVRDPVGALSEAGIDTVDGLLFVNFLPDGVNSGPADLFKAVVYLIPRQLYSAKPEFLSNILSEQYLGFGTAGMFLSGVGYLILILGGSVGALLGFGLLGGIWGSFVRTRGGSISWVVATYVLVRFYMGGDAFDIFKGLQLSLILACAFLFANMTKRSERRNG